MNPELEQRIKTRAYEIWEYRQHCGMLYMVDRLGNIREITAQDDWLEAEQQLKEHVTKFHKKFDIKNKDTGEDFNG